MFYLKSLFSLLSVSVVLTGCGGAATDETTDARSIVDDLAEVPSSGQNSQQGDSADNTDEEQGSDTTDNQSGSTDEVASNDDQNTSEEEVPPYTQDTMSASVTLEPAGFYEDGSVMSQDEISHYQIIYGTDSNNLDQSYELSMSGILSFDFEATAHQTWYVAVKTVSIYGGESLPSNIIAFNF